MAIIKAKQKEYHARVPNDTARDRKLSLKAKGLLCVLLSMDDDWKIYKKQIAEFSTDKYDATSAAFDELIEKGYIINHGRKRGSKGILGECLYEVFAEKQRLEQIEPNRDFPDLDNPDLDNPDLSNYTIPYSHSIENKEEENQEVNLNINAETSSAPETDLFGESLKNSQDDKKIKPAKKKKETTAHPAHVEIRKYWYDEFSIGERFHPGAGKFINEIIANIESYISSKKGDTSPSKIVEFFKVLCSQKNQSKNAFVASAGLSVLSSPTHFKSIIDSIENNGKQINHTGGRAGVTNFKFGYADPRKQPAEGDML